MKQYILHLAFLIGMTGCSYGQSTYWKKNSLNQSKGTKEVFLRSDLNQNTPVFTLKTERLKQVLTQVGKQGRGTDKVLDFPNSTGDIVRFKMEEYAMMEPELAAKFPRIKTYIGKSVDGNGTTIHLSVTPLGVHGLLKELGGQESYIDTYNLKDETYVVYNRADQQIDKDFKCLVESASKSSPIDLKNKEGISLLSNKNNPLRTFRLAMACTVEYADFHIKRAGLSNASVQEKKEAVLAAMVVTMNRVNSIYERDMAVHMNLIGDNDKLIFIDNDEFTNDNANRLIYESQRVIDKTVGYASYDIGHTVSTGGGGLAQLGVPCTTQKAMGITGSPQPIGDPYDIDYVAHEMGHQFGANHTFNNYSGGNRNFATAYEPGSGSTIMGYAGISDPNIQRNSDAYFHIVSIIEMQNALSRVDACSIKTVVENKVPIVSAGKNYTIPVGTPFILKGSAEGENANKYTYTWEQMDNETATQPPVSSSKEGPTFRSLAPSLSPVRYMPSFDTVLDGKMGSTWEVLPTVARIMNFTFTARSFANGIGGQNDYQTIRIMSVGTLPFKIKDLGTKDENDLVEWTENKEEIITWDVVNTTGKEINTTEVNILYSKDNGATFETLASNVPNTGSVKIRVPKGVTEEARVMIQPVDNIYYAVSTQFKVKAGEDVSKLLESTNFIVYPNPSVGEFNIAFKSQTKREVSVRLYDVSGKMVFNQTYEGAENFNQLIQASGIRSGVYMLKVDDGGEVKHSKVVIK
ncbi:MAG: M12 family metallo-peptidase [Flavobacteriaceae bacterium]|nr:M12 family metallo-peptidase [Flavobacteriaceae bacterium]